MSDLKILSVEDCDAEIAKYQKMMEDVDDCFDGEQASLRAECYVILWERLKHHAIEGRIVTIDSKRRIHLLSENQPTRQ